MSNLECERVANRASDQWQTVRVCLLIFNNTTENNTFITNINVDKIQTEYCEYHFAQIHVHSNKQKKIQIFIKVVHLGIRMAYWPSSCVTFVATGVISVEHILF